MKPFSSFAMLLSILIILSSQNLTLLKTNFFLISRNTFRKLISFQEEIFNQTWFILITLSSVSDTFFELRFVLLEELIHFIIF